MSEGRSEVRKGECIANLALLQIELDIDPGAETPQEEKSFAEGVVGEMDVEAQERKFHLGGYIEKKGVRKGGSGKELMKR